MMCHFSQKQVPCAKCHGDALPIGTRASDFGLMCVDCDTVTCRSCSSFQISESLRGLRCPFCERTATPMFLYPQPAPGAAPMRADS